jgi:hypothetical protein
MAHQQGKTMIFELLPDRLEDIAQIINEELGNKKRSFSREVKAEMDNTRVEALWLAKSLREVERRLTNEYTNEDFIRAADYVKAVRAAP